MDYQVAEIEECADQDGKTSVIMDQHMVSCLAANKNLPYRQQILKLLKRRNIVLEMSGQNIPFKCVGINNNETLFICQELNAIIILWST